MINLHCGFYICKTLCTFQIYLCRSHGKFNAHSNTLQQISRFTANFAILSICVSYITLRIINPTVCIIYANNLIQNMYLSLLVIKHIIFQSRNYTTIPGVNLYVKGAYMQRCISSNSKKVSHNGRKSFKALLILLNTLKHIQDVCILKVKLSIFH